MGLITNLILDVLVFFYQITGNLGFAILLFTAVVRSLLLPLTIKSLRMANQMKDIQPELQKLKLKHGNDKEKMQKAQMELYQKHNINPLAGCLPQLVQIGLLIVLYQVLLNFLGKAEVHGVSIDQSFFWLDLGQPDPLYILPVLAGATQLVLSLMIAPGAETPDIIPNASKKKAVQEANKKEENMAEMAASMQKQMIFIMPFMTAFIALRFPSGLALYWVATTVYSIGQQWAITGPGGLVTYTKRALALVQGLSNRPEQK